MSDKQRITIIGTGCVGASLGMALRASSSAPRIEVVGHDREARVARRAQKEGAFDRVEVNLHRALMGARLVILAVPLAEEREVLSDLGRLLEPGEEVVVTDTTPLKVPVLQWAAELLPESAHFVGGDPFLAPREEEAGLPRYVTQARADLLDDAVYAIVARAQEHPSAVQAVANLARTVGAHPLYMDPAEHDAARALSLALPDLLATALLSAALEGPGSHEVRRAAGRAFATATAAAAGDPTSRHMLALLARPALLRGLDATMEGLAELRRALAEGDGEGLERALAAAGEARERWMSQSLARAWEEEPALPETGGVLEKGLQALLGGLRGGKDPDTA